MRFLCRLRQPLPATSVVERVTEYLRPDLLAKMRAYVKTYRHRRSDPAERAAEIVMKDCSADRWSGKVIVVESAINPPAQPNTVRRLEIGDSL